MFGNQRLLALLIDGDNISSKQIEEILDKASAAGKLLIKRVYVNKSSMAQWESVINEYSLTPFWVSNNTTNKNSVDIALVVDTMTLLYERPDLTGFCLVSSDSDFTVLARHILTKDKFVLGLGQASTPAAFRNACTRFVELNPIPNATPIVVTVEPPPVKIVDQPIVTPTVPTPEKTVEPPKVAISKQSPVQPVVKPISKPVIHQSPSSQDIELNRIRQAYEHAAHELNRKDKDGWVNLSQVRSSLKTLHPSYDPLIYKGEKIGQLKKVIERMMQNYPSTVDIKTVGLTTHIRFKPSKTPKS